MGMNDIIAADAKYRRSKESGMGIRANKQSLMNLMFNCKDELIDMIRSKDKDKSVNVIDQTDFRVKALEEENARLNEQIEQLEEQIRKLKTSRRGNKVKKAGDDMNEQPNSD